MVSFASIPKNVYFLSTVYVTVISQRLHSQLVMRNEGILKNGTEFLMKTGGKKDFSQPSAKKYTGNNMRPSMEYWHLEHNLKRHLAKSTCFLCCLLRFLIFFPSLSPSQEISQALKSAPCRYYALVKIIFQTSFALQKCTKFVVHLRGG